MSSVLVSAPTFEHHHSGLGIEQPRPRISWRFDVRKGAVVPSSWRQTQYELEIALGDHAQFTAYEVKSAQSVLVPWPAQSLVQQQSARVRVRCLGVTSTGEGQLTEWSETATVETALLEQRAWKARFIASSERGSPEGPLRPLRFRKEISLLVQRGKPRKARLYITALGIFDAYIDGRRVSDGLLAPGWTDY